MRGILPEGPDCLNGQMSGPQSAVHHPEGCVNLGLQWAQLIRLTPKALLPVVPRPPACSIYMAQTLASLNLQRLSAPVPV